MRTSSLLSSCYPAGGSFARPDRRWAMAAGAPMFAPMAIALVPVTSWANGSHVAKRGNPTPLALQGGWTG